MRIRSAVTLTISLFAFSAFAGDEMQKLSWLIGDWKGSASMQMGPGSPKLAVQTEHVEAKLGGKLLVIEGHGKRKNEDGSVGEVVHDAFGVISWDARKGGYRFDAWTAREGYVAATLTAGDRDIAWGFDVPNGGKIRYTIRMSENGEWLETGELSRDGTAWLKFFDMKLTK